MRLEEIPDRWKQFNPERPPYRYFGNRSRTATNWITLGCTVVLTVGGIMLIQHLVRRQDDRSEWWREQMETNLSYAEHDAVQRQTDGLKAIIMRNRRRHLGLPERQPGSCEIQDF